MSELVILLDIKKMKNCVLFIAKLENYLGATFVTESALKSLQLALRTEIVDIPVIFPRLETFNIESFLKKCQSKNCKSMYS